MHSGRKSKMHSLRKRNGKKNKTKQETIRIRMIKLDFSKHLQYNVEAQILILVGLTISGFLF